VVKRCDIRTSLETTSKGLFGVSSRRGRDRTPEDATPGDDETFLGPPLILTVVFDFSTFISRFQDDIILYLTGCSEPGGSPDSVYPSF